MKERDSRRDEEIRSMEMFRRCINSARRRKKDDKELHKLLKSINEQAYSKGKYDALDEIYQLFFILATPLTDDSAPFYYIVGYKQCAKKGIKGKDALEKSIESMTITDMKKLRSEALRGLGNITKLPQLPLWREKTNVNTELAAINQELTEIQKYVPIVLEKYFELFAKAFSVDGESDNDLYLKRQKRWFKIGRIVKAVDLLNSIGYPEPYNVIATLLSFACLPEETNRKALQKRYERSH